MSINIGGISTIQRGVLVVGGEGVVARQIFLGAGAGSFRVTRRTFTSPDLSATPPGFGFAPELRRWLVVVVCFRVFGCGLTQPMCKANVASVVWITTKAHWKYLVYLG